MESSNSSGRIVELDVLRGFAALNVVFFHYTTKFREEFGHSFSSKLDWPYGHFGVQLFFVISGFVIFLTLQSIKTTGEFAYKRFTRLYPTYWICLILTFTVVSIFGLPGREVPVYVGLVDLTMFQGLFKLLSVDGAYWSLLPELLFYIMMGALFQFKLLKNIRTIGVIWMIVIICNIYYHPIPYIHILLNFRFGMLFFAGIMFYKIKSGTHKIYDHLIILLCLIAAVLSDLNYPSLVANLIIFSLFYLFVYGKLTAFAKKPLIFLGVISYPLYLLHQNIGFVLIRALRKVIPNEIVVIIIVIMLLILLAWVVTDFIEKPIRKRLRRGHKKTQPAKVILPA